MKISKIQQNTPNFNAKLNITGAYQFKKKTVTELKKIAKNIGNKNDILTVHTGEETYSPYAGQCFAPNICYLPIDITYTSKNVSNGTKFGIQLGRYGNPESGLTEILKNITNSKICDIPELFNNLRGRLHY